MNISFLHVALFAVAGSLLAPALSTTTQDAAELQFPDASPAAKVEQRIGLTDVSVEYSRPGVKGRKIFGGLQPYGEIWRTGANTATKLSFSGDVKFGGSAVPAGSYALFTIPGEKEWTVILNKVEGQWGAYTYDEKQDQLRVKVKPVSLAESVETMTIGLGDLRDDSATLEIVWDKTRIPVKIETDLVKTMVTKIEAAMAGNGKKPYFPAAMFYFDHNLDLKKSVTWIDAAIKENPTALWIIYRKGLILEKLGDKAGAIAAATQSMELAKKAEPALAEEYTRLNQQLIARCK